MLRRIGIWAMCGCAIALIWALVFYLLGPGNAYYPTPWAVLHYLAHSAIVSVTVPVALLGQHHAITWYWSAVINAAIYAVLGLAVELVWMPFRSRIRHLHP